VPTSFMYVSGAVGNIMTLLIREVADCKGSGQSC